MDYELALSNVLVLLNEVETRGMSSVQNLHNAFQLVQKMLEDVRLHKGREKRDADDADARHGKDA